MSPRFNLPSAVDKRCVCKAHWHPGFSVLVHMQDGNLEMLLLPSVTAMDEYTVPAHSSGRVNEQLNYLPSLRSSCGSEPAAGHHGAAGGEAAGCPGEASEIQADRSGGKNNGERKTAKQEGRKLQRKRERYGRIICYCLLLSWHERASLAIPAPT